MNILGYFKQVTHLCHMSHLWHLKTEGSLRMKLNIDCVRDLLLAIESEVNFTENLKYPSVNINSLCESDFLKKYQKCDICYAALKLNEGGFIDLTPTYGDNRITSILIDSLTYEGHQFLESIKPPNVWTKTKNKAAKIGSFAVDIVSQIAIDYILKNIT